MSLKKSFLGKILPISVLLLLIPTISFAQKPITMDQAIEMALSNNPRLKSASAAIERNKAARGESWEVAPTSIEYGGGQLNGRDYDNQLTITQSFGSPIVPFYKNALVKNRVANATIMREMVQREVIAEVKRAWVGYIYTAKLCQIYSSQKELADKLENSGKIRYQAGEINLLEQKMSTSLSLTMQTNLLQAQKEHQTAAARLRWVCFAQSDVAPSDSTLDFYKSVNIISDSVSELYTKYYEGVNREQKAALDVERSRISPEIFASYQRQTILPEKGLNSYSVGISFPILFMPQRSRIRQANFALSESINNSQAALRDISLRLIELETQIKLYIQNIELYNTTLLSQAQELRRATTLQLQNSDIDITQAIQAINSAVEIEKSYLTTLYQSSIAVLEYELYK